MRVAEDCGVPEGRRGAELRVGGAEGSQSHGRTLVARGSMGWRVGGANGSQRVVAWDLGASRGGEA